MFVNDNTTKYNQLKTALNRIYGRTMMSTAKLYVDTDSILDIDCDFCRNANTCPELTPPYNDLSYMSCGLVWDDVRMLFRSGNNLKTKLLVEKWDGKQWEILGELAPNYCPFCGRPLFENIIPKENKNV